MEVVYKGYEDLYVTSSLTLGKAYTIITEEYYYRDGENYYIIINDGGYPSDYKAKVFISLAEERENKINKILE